MILQCAVRAARQSAETATARTRDLLHTTNAQHGAGSRVVLVSSAGQQADGGQARRETAPQMPLRGRSSHRLRVRNMRVTWVELRRFELRTSDRKITLAVARQRTLAGDRRQVWLARVRRRGRG